MQNDPACGAAKIVSDRRRPVSGTKRITGLRVRKSVKRSPAGTLKWLDFLILI
jgi:hypothetical protein